MRAYPHYRDSGVEWLGEVPEHWDVRPLKSVLARNDGGVWGVDPEGDEGTIVFMGETGSNAHSYRMNQPVAELHGLSGRQREMRFMGVCPNGKCREWDDWRFEVEDGKVVRVWPLDAAGA